MLVTLASSKLVVKVRRHAFVYKNFSYRRTPNPSFFWKARVFWVNPWKIFSLLIECSLKASGMCIKGVWSRKVWRTIEPEETEALDKFTFCLESLETNLQRFQQHQIGELNLRQLEHCAPAGIVDASSNYNLCLATELERAFFFLPQWLGKVYLTCKWIYTIVNFFLWHLFLNGIFFLSNPPKKNFSKRIIIAFCYI